MGSATMRLVAGGLLAVLLLSTGEARAAQGNDNLTGQAWACSSLFTRYPVKVRNSDDIETAVCLGEGQSGRMPMSRSEAWELCREQFNTTTLLLAWTGRGWHCRYYDR